MMKSTSVWLCDKQVSVCNTITLKLFQSVVSLLIFMDSVSRPELFHWKLCLVSEKTAVFTPNIVIRITITATTAHELFIPHAHLPLPGDAPPQ